jgi:dienelactone hydrolase
MDLNERKIAIRIISVFILLIILIVAGILIFRPGRPSFDYESNKLVYPDQRSPPKYSMNKLSETENYTLYKVIYDSKPFLDQDAKIYSLLYLPKISGEIPGVLFLPGGGITKENEPAAPAIANLGYAVLVIDQRGLGETGGFYPNYDQDRLLFIETGESIQHLGVYDAIRGLDTLRQIKTVDQDNLFVAGSSMGGRYAIITAQLYPNLKGAIILSSAGFHVEKMSGAVSKDPYFLSLDPDRYIENVSPIKIVMIHSTADEVINIRDAAATYILAKDPKSFHAVSNCSHGYCPDMLPIIKSELDKLTE